MTVVFFLQVSEQEQVEALWALQGNDHPLEQELAEAHITRVEAFQGGGLHAGDLYEVVLETGRLTYFKPANGLLNLVGKRALTNYAHTPLSTVISECAAWQLAKQLRAPWDDLIAPATLRFVTLPNGSRDVGALTLYRPGKDRQRGFLDRASDQASAGAFFDALIGQQDRNEGNVLWYEERQAIYLIDHGFSFAVPGANSGEVVLSSWRANHGSADLSTAELEALARGIEADWFELQRFVAPDRMEAFVARTERMLGSRRMLGLGVF
jgi:hypothetical protein